MEFIKSNHKKKRNRTWIVLLIIVFIIVLAAGSWIGYNGWDIQRSIETLMSAGDSQNKGGDGEMIPTGGDPTETEEVPEQQPADPEVDPDEVPKQPDEESGVKSPEQKPSNEVNPPTQAEPTTDSGGYIEGMKLPEKPKYIKGILIANKKNPLPQNFAPGESQEAREAFDKLSAEAKLAGFELVAFSTFRSFDYQTTLYNRYVERDGQDAADRYSARPGYSEHQTGLAFDIGEKNFEQYWASSEFGNTPAGQWIAENAHKYGFILRYPKGKEEITGYMHESWHFRYVGEGIARDIYVKDLTLEEYLNIQ